MNISGDLFQERKRPAPRTGILKLVVLIAAASLVTAAGTWFALEGKEKKSPADIPQPVQQTPAPVRPAVTAPPVPVAVPVQQPLPTVASGVSTVAAPVVPVKSADVARPTPVVRHARISKEKVSLPSPNRTTLKTKSRTKSKIKTKATTETPKQVVQTVPAPADIKLSGIAWQDEHSLRRAVVNGFLLKEGATVSGSRITNIQSDRVRFSSPSGEFVIKLDAVPTAEVKQ